MAHPVIHAEIRSTDPDATRAFFGSLFGWSYEDGAFPGYTFANTGADGGIPTAIGPLQGGKDAVLFFIGSRTSRRRSRGRRSSAGRSSSRRSRSPA